MHNAVQLGLPLQPAHTSPALALLAACRGTQQALWPGTQTRACATRVPLFELQGFADTKHKHSTRLPRSLLLPIEKSGINFSSGKRTVVNITGSTL